MPRSPHRGPKPVGSDPAPKPVEFTPNDVRQSMLGEAKRYFSRESEKDPALRPVADWAREVYKFVNRVDIDAVQAEYDQLQATPEEQAAMQLWDLDTYGAVDPRMAVAAPETSLGVSYYPASVEERLIYSANSTYRYLASWYGEEQVANFIRAMQISNDPAQQQLAMETIKTLSGQNWQDEREVEMIAAGKGGAVNREVPAEPVSDETLTSVLQDPARVLDLTPGQRNWVLEMAAKTNEAGVLEPDVSSQLLEQFQRVFAPVASRNFEAALSPEDVAALKTIETFVRQGPEDRAMFGFDPSTVEGLDQAYAQLGVVEVRAAGTGSPEIIFNEVEMDDAARASVITAFMEDRFPHLRYRVGDGGVFADIAYAWDKSVDTVAAVPGAALVTAADAITEGWEAGQVALGTSISREDARRMVDDLKGRVARQEIPYSELEDTQRMIKHFEDRAGTDIATPGEAYVNILTPEEAGFGFADTMLDANDVLPGDPNYGGIRAGLFIASQVVFDPTNYIIPGWGGVKAAGKGVKLFAESVARSGWKAVDDFFRAAKLTETAVDQAGDIALGLVRGGKKLEVGDETLSASQIVTSLQEGGGKLKGGILERVGTGRQVTMYADEVAEASPFTWDEFLKGLEAQEIPIVRSADGRAAMVLNASTTEGYAWARRMGMNHFRSADGWVDVSKRTIDMHSSVGVAREGVAAPGSFTFKAPGGKPTTLTWETVGKARPLKIQGIGRGYIRNAVFRSMAPDLEEFIANPAFTEAADMIQAIRASSPTKALFAGKLHRMGIGDAKLIDKLYRASTADHTRIALTSAVTGRTKDLDDVMRLLDDRRAIDELTAQARRDIDSIDAARNDFAEFVERGEFPRADVPAPGEIAVPEGHRAYYHEASAQSLEGIRERGLLGSARTSFGEGRQVFAHELTPDQALARLAELPEDRILIEFKARPENVSGRGTMGNPAVSFAGDIPSGEITHIWTPEEIAVASGRAPNLAGVAAATADPAALVALAKARTFSAESAQTMLDVVNRRLEQLVRPSQDKLRDLFVDRKYVSSLIQGNVADEPLRAIPKGFRAPKDVLGRKKAFEKVAAGDPKTADLMGGLADYAGALPQWAIDRLHPSVIGRLIEGDTRIKAGFRRALTAFHDMSAGEEIIMPWQVAAQKADAVLGDTVNESMHRIRNVLKQYDVPEADIEHMIGKLLTEGTNESRGYELWNEVWELAATKGRRVDPDSIDEVKQIASRVTTEEGSKPSVLRDGRPTAWIEDADGVTHTQPAWTADKRQVYMIRGAAEIKAQTTRVGKWLSRNQGKMRTVPYRAVAKTMQAWGSTWKSLVLIGKMPVSLIGRIIAEEQLRGMALGYGSAFNHPIEWFRGVRNADELDLFFRSAEYGVGIIERDLVDTMGRANKAGFLVAKGTTRNTRSVYAHALAGRIQSLNASPEASLFLRGSRPEEIWAKIQAKADGGVGWAASQRAMLERSALGPVEQIKRMQQEIDDVIGGSEKVRGALRTGRYGGKALDDPGVVGALTKDLEIGKWDPKLMEVRANTSIIGPLAMRGVGGGLTNATRSFRDKLFEMTYSRPDLRFSRNPLFSQLANEEYARLMALGWNDRKALDAAKFHASRKVQDAFFKVGGSNSVHYFMRNISPFMPAWQELFSTWAFKVPKALGAGHTSLGYARMSKIFTNSRRALEEAGILKQDSRGSYYVEIAGQKARLSTLGGLLPLPDKVPFKDDWSEVVASMGPGVGAMPQTIIAALANQFDGLADTAADYTMLFGTEYASLGPSSWATMWETMFNSPAPWELTTKSFREQEIIDTMWDGMRIAIAQSPPPEQTDYETSEEYRKAYSAWAADIIETGNEHQNKVGLIRGLSSMFSPWKLYEGQDYADAELSMLKQLVDVANENTSGEARLDDYRTFVMDTWLRAHPGLDAYILSNKIDLNETPYNEREYGEFGEWADRQFESIEPEALPYWAAWRMEERQYYARRARLQARLGDTVGSYLANVTVRRQLLEEKVEREEWIDWFKKTGQGGRVTDLATLRYEHINGISPSPYDVTLTREQEQALEKMNDLRDRNNEIYWKDGRRTPAYYETIGPVRDIASKINWAEPTTKLGKQIDRYWEHATKYYDRINPLYDLAEQTPSALRGPLYDEIRRISTKQKPLVIDGEALWTPEEYAFWNRSDIEQQDKMIEWAARPIEWLTPFQRDRIGISAGPKWDRFASWQAEQEAAFTEKWGKEWAGDSDRTRAREQLDKAIQARAETMGVEDILRLNDVGAYRRINIALAPENGSWKRAMALADEARAWIRAKGSRPDTENTESRRVWVTVLPAIQAMYEQDEGFRELMDDMGVALAPKGTDRIVGADLYLKLFFDYYQQDNAPYWIADMLAGGS